MRKSKWKPQNINCLILIKVLITIRPERFNHRRFSELIIIESFSSVNTRWSRLRVVSKKRFMRFKIERNPCFFERKGREMMLKEGEEKCWENMKSLFASEDNNKKHLCWIIIWFDEERRERDIYLSNKYWNFNFNVHQLSLWSLRVLLRFKICSIF